MRVFRETSDDRHPTADPIKIDFAKGPGTDSPPTTCRRGPGFRHLLAYAYRAAIDRP